ncbi:MAG: tRNA lysidine(34) synthetase TilS [Candidatus Gracilibacteria bacterium]|jgi:tRNA(Ile)-lysidine synthase
MNQQEKKKLEKKILDVLGKYVRKNDTVIVGFSGGPDSVMLLTILAEYSQKVHIKIVPAHINHMLRGKESDRDEKFVEGTAKKYKFKLEKIRKNIVAESKKNKTGIEETGRKIRYEFFKSLAKKYKAEFVITAHHADDNLETIIMNFARGAHLKGLYGMEEIENFSEKTKLLRPLIEIPKDKILDYLKTCKIKYRVDKSNKDTKYKRNYIREKIVPLLKNINPNLAESVAKNSADIKDAYQYISSAAEKWIKENALNKDLTEFNAPRFLKETESFKKQILMELHKILVGTTKDLKNIHLDEVLNVISKGWGNKKKKLGKLVIYLKNGIIKILLK